MKTTSKYRKNCRYGLPASGFVRAKAGNSSPGSSGVRAMGEEVRATCDSGRVRGDSVRASGILFCAHQTS